MGPLTDTIAAPSTAVSGGALAVVRVSGADAVAVVERLLTPGGRRLSGLRTWSAMRAVLTEPATGVIIDDAVVTLFRAPRSYTGEDVVEVSCHGGRATVEGVLGALLCAGARAAEPGEFTYRAYRNGKMDLTAAESVADQIAALTGVAARAAADSRLGALREALADVRESLVAALAETEADISFPDEAPDMDAGAVEHHISAAAASLADLIASARSGALLGRGARVVLTGPPNAGKSSLFNALAGCTRAIVSPHPGTTRDLIECVLDLEGYPLTLVDTAGLRDTDVEVERLGVELAVAAAASADVIVRLHDAADSSDDVCRATDVGPTLHVISRCDLTDPDTLRRRAARLPDGALRVSSATGDGLAELQRAIVERLGGSNRPAETATLTRERHRAEAAAALGACQRALTAVSSGQEPDLVAVDLHDALSALDRLGGAGVTEEVLDRIFAEFCVGK
ncbi:MAG: tRNA uridine-5-carboxymethylaminomethyl(34) synthesis GTPase MnmE [Armatimonadetes bacterium]|nr:tRNA uridine-5-carboxymethylaminomethyl(34) synthesis GTPase MnmE [Armatimonadota bacterium]